MSYGQHKNTHNKPVGYQQITSLGTAQALTVPSNARMAMVQPTGQSVRWRDDGTNPTASIGMVIAAGDIMEFTTDLSALRFIQTTASAVLNISYYE
jgi:hypothetical protein